MNRRIALQAIAFARKRDRFASAADHCRPNGAHTGQLDLTNAPEVKITGPLSTG